ncbi:MAG: biotin--[acetyl-CoA-carboxylase] ligase [Bacteroidetes bacterium GWF2_49_14]|nr:MAG: biotin--[acetyl-CoA-carboxylase] ligase [Bacteroidetes bacterium GWF2_49_14]HBB93275.1 biotin--[acetyl-CoA-carboxylase] ligase [Bacteroidales bacterium]
MHTITKIFRKRVSSTNIFAASLIADGNSTEPFWIRTDDQYAGRGQGAHTWKTEPGKNLTGSLVIFPDGLQGAAQFFLSMTFSLAAADFLSLFTDQVKIKWPNDLYVNGEKIGGILIETSILGNYLHHAILGIGININQEIFPATIPNPLSLRQISGQNYDLEEMEDLFLESFRNRYRYLEAGNRDTIRKEYLEKMLRFDQPGRYKASEREFTARIVDVNEFGYLILQEDSGVMQEFAFQEVEYLF